jgi:hypothetical protein
MASKRELLRFLDSRVFNPILKAKPEDYKESDRKALADVQGSTGSEQERFHGYKDTAEIVSNFKRDLHSETAKRINPELRRLKLPSLPSVKDEFLEMTGEGKPKTRTAGGR